MSRERSDWNLKKIRIMRFIVLTLLLVLLSPNTAHASSSVMPSAINLDYVSAEMTIVGIDEEIAAKAGNRIKVINGYKILINGFTGLEIARVPLNLNTNKLIGVITPMNVVTGNCGTAYIYLQNLGNSLYQYSTGFDLTSGYAYDFDWYISIIAEWTYPYSGSYNFAWDDHGPLWPSQHWSSGWKVDDTTAPFGTLHVGRVTSGTVYRTDGAICYSGYPTSSVRVY